MTGLRDWVRDGSLPARAGDTALRPASEDELTTLVGRALPRTDGPPPVASTWTYARWKPGVSITCAYEVRFEDDARATVVTRRFAGPAKLPSRSQVDRVSLELTRSGATSPVLPSFAAVGGLLLWPARADRRLPGLRAASDLRHLRRLLLDAGLFDGRVLSRQRSAVQTLRHRPESRGVLRLDACLKGPGAERERLRRALALRCLPPARARRVVARRRALGAFDGVPALLAWEVRSGVLVEPWLDVEVPAPDAFGHAPAAGRALAALHARPLSGGRAAALTAPAEDMRDLAACFAWDPALHRAARNGLRPAPASDGPPRWTHGDLHPDQVACTRDGSPVLLDLDALHAGDPAADLASWIADRLACATSTFDDAAGPLLAGHAEAGGSAPADRHLRAWVAHELVRRAAASLRRLEHGAVDRARQLLDLAEGVRSSGDRS